MYPVREIVFKNDLKATNEYNLSLLVPVYNSEKYIRKCLNSLVNQNTNFKYEIILVDDGSSDRSAEIIDEYEKLYDFVFIYHQKNSGTSAARNKAVRLARGEYIGFIDNDDFVEPNYVDLLLSKAYETNADIVRCGHNRFDVQKNEIISSRTYKDVILEGDIGSEILNISGFVWEGISKRSLWNDCTFPEGYWFEDMITHLVLMRKAERIVCLKEVLYYYNIHQTNAFKTVWKNNDIKCIDQLYLVELLLKQYEYLGKQKMLAYTVIHECGEVLWLRIRRLKSNLQKDIFNAAAALVTTALNGEKEQFDNISEYEKLMFDIMKKRSFHAWQMLCCAKMLETKRKNEIGR
ncbi:MAG: glycosyltransferase family 2 protein [Clostridiales bacterium]|nr:glycosyltransferase family 2 protein [Clostridiales bacterium]